ncbi:acyl-CoA N-acyltransferase [Xylogone sp. PMI_703]|nr:acyl-CoA N-acyltransferase [Xylogone sp. PMI_703]
MADASEDWSADSNDAVIISLVNPSEGGARAVHTFNPKMTYSIFGDEERIFGYQGLKINLKYNASDMRPNLQVNYSKKFKSVGETEPTDVKAILENYLPKLAFEKASVFDTAISDPSYKSWTPPGELYKTIESGGKHYEVWKGSLADMAVQQMLKRIQILVPFFIEGGTFIELQDPEWSLERWTVFFLYEKIGSPTSASPYVFIGYSTIYRYYLFRPKKSQPGAKSHATDLDFELPLSEISFLDFPCRSRISQFLILPPFQGAGNGARFYNAIFDFYLNDHQTIEITVEDPNESFDDLRDLNDLARLRKDPEFAALRISTSVVIRSKGPLPKGIVDQEKLDRIRTKYKIAPRQFARVTEMQLLSLIPKSVRQSLIIEQPRSTGPELKTKEHEYHLWQLLVKQRLYKHNKDMLMQLDRAERVDKLEQTLGGVEADYARLLRALDEKSANNGSTVSDIAVRSNGKRAAPEEETEESLEPVSKKVRIVEE